ncbi:MAG: rRNA maturation RNase YbeY [Cyanobacteria bacterium J06641_5]
MAGLLPAPAWGQEVTWQPWFQQWLSCKTVRLPAACGYELGLRLSDDRALQRLNARYRHIELPTDVLAFAALEAMPMPAEVLASEPLYLGDIEISVETAMYQAQARGHTVGSELVWLASHGLLHLLGWDHPDRDRLQAMLQCQEHLLRISGHTIPEWQQELSKY